MKTIPDILTAIEETRLSDCDKSVLKRMLESMTEPEPPVELGEFQVWRNKNRDEIIVFPEFNRQCWYGVWSPNDYCTKARNTVSNGDFKSISEDLFLRKLTAGDYSLVGTAELVVKYSEKAVSL